MKDYIVNLLSYNVWANGKIASYIANAGEDRSLMIQKSSFESIQKTLLHIWDAEFIWLNRLNGILITTWPGKSFQGSTQDGCVGLLNTSNELLSFFTKLSDEKILSSVAYNNIKGELHSNTIIEISSHVVNHGTYHRGQLITMLRNAGFSEPGSTDLINYYRELKS